MDEIDRDQAFNEQLLNRMIACARTEPEHTPSLFSCRHCGEPIPEKRRQLIQGVFLCIECQRENEQHKRHHAL